MKGAGQRSDHSVCGRGNAALKQLAVPRGLSAHHCWCATRAGQEPAPQGQRLPAPGTGSTEKRMHLGWKKGKDPGLMALWPWASFLTSLSFTLKNWNDFCKFIKITFCNDMVTTAQS